MPGSEGVVMPGAFCVLSTSTAIGCCNKTLLPARAPDLNLLFDISSLLIALSYAVHR